jgi:uncharacterized protein YoaH (UPF0181 family)
MWRTAPSISRCCTAQRGVFGPEAYEEAGGALATDAGERLYWLVRDGLASSEEVQVVAQTWRRAGRTKLTTRAVEERLDAYVTALMNALG